jgi:hypothetical protein
MVLKGFEQRLEQMVEGTFSRVFRSGLRPVEIGRRIIREMDNGRQVGVSGGTIVPNHYRVWLSPSDDARFLDMHDSLLRELAEAVREHAREEAYSFVGPVLVELIPSDRLRTGTFTTEGTLTEGSGGLGAGSLLLTTGQRIALTEHPVLIGRSDDCGIVLQDGNVSRHHAEIRPAGEGFAVVDLGSTNGTTVNGIRIAEQQLHDGDEVHIGGSRILFEAS